MQGRDIIVYYSADLDKLLDDEDSDERPRDDIPYARLTFPTFHYQGLTLSHLLMLSDSESESFKFKLVKKHNHWHVIQVKARVSSLSST